MATIQVTNQKASQSLRGQAVIVTLDDTDSAELANISEGDSCVNDSSGKTGTIYSVDTKGHSFKISPIQPDRDFASASVYGYLAVNETITITT